MLTEYNRIINSIEYLYVYSVDCVKSEINLLVFTHSVISIRRNFYYLRFYVGNLLYTCAIRVYSPRFRFDTLSFTDHIFFQTNLIPD